MARFIKALAPGCQTARARWGSSVACLDLAVPIPPTPDWRPYWRIDKRWSVAVGIDNLACATCWNFHPYPQRSGHAGLPVDI